MKSSIQIICLLFALLACQTEKIDSNNNASDFLISAVDISNYPEIANYNLIFSDINGIEKNFLSILKENGVNTIRLRLWVNPKNNHSSFSEVQNFSAKVKNNGFKTWLTIHYSDTWADPGNQETPKKWQQLNFSELKDSVYSYTKMVVTQIKPDYVQIGNEINSGFLHPSGNLNTNFSQFVELLKTASSAIRIHKNDTKIIIHYAGINGADWFYNQIISVDYDIIGLSYYPIWHGKSLTELKTTMGSLSTNFNKNIVIAETAYPFTLAWNDWTNNIIGTTDQIIFPDYPATPDGQTRFIKQIKSICNEVPNGLGFCYWGAELISWKGNNATDASPWENQALFDFNNKALPVLNEF